MSVCTKGYVVVVLVNVALSLGISSLVSSLI